MSPLWTHRGVPRDVVQALAPSGGERLLASGSDGQGTLVVTGLHRLYVLDTRGSEPKLVLDRPWHLVDSGTWSSVDVALRVTWVDDIPPLRIALTEPGRVPETLRERVQTSVVVSEDLALPGRRVGRVVVRRVLETGDLVSQAVLPGGVDPGAAQVEEALRVGLARVREQVGLD